MANSSKKPPRDAQERLSRLAALLKEPLRIETERLHNSDQHPERDSQWSSNNMDSDIYCFAWVHPLEEFLPKWQSPESRLRAALRRHVTHILMLGLLHEDGCRVVISKIRCINPHLPPTNVPLNVAKWQWKVLPVSPVRDADVRRDGSIVVRGLYINPRKEDIIVEIVDQKKDEMYCKEEFWRDAKDPMEFPDWFGFERVHPSSDSPDQESHHRTENRSYNSIVCTDHSFLNLTAVKGMQKAYGTVDRSSFVMDSPPHRKKNEKNEPTYIQFREKQAINWCKIKLEEGVALARAGKYDVAISCYDQALGINPKSVDAYVARGAAYANKNRLVLAVKDLEKALEMDPMHANAQKYLRIAKRKLDTKQINTLAPPPMSATLPGSSSKSKPNGAMSSIGFDTRRPSLETEPEPQQRHDMLLSSVQEEGLERSRLRRLLESESIASSKRKSSSSRDRDRERDRDRDRDRSKRRKSSSKSTKSKKRTKKEKKSKKRKKKKSRHRSSSSSSIRKRSRSRSGSDFSSSGSDSSDDCSSEAGHRRSRASSRGNSESSEVAEVPHPILSRRTHRLWG